MKFSHNWFVLAIAINIICLSGCSRDDDPPPATASFRFTSTKSLPATVQFTNLTTAGVGSTYLWEFGDGATSNIQHPTHLYVQQGTYQVRLTHTPTTGSPETVMKELAISLNGPSGNSHKPSDTQAADFSMTVSYGVPYFVTFTNTSTNATSYYWDFDDNGISNSTSTTVTHTFNTAGPYYVILHATNDSGTDTCGALISF